MRNSRHFRFLFAAALTASLAAQTIPNLGDTSSPAPTAPGHALIGGAHETVNPANGSLTLRFDVRLPPGRGLTPTFAITYSSAGSQIFGSLGNSGPSIFTQSSTFSSDGWSYGAPVLTFSTRVLPSPDGVETCKLSTSYIAQLADGERRDLQLSTVGRAPGTKPPEYDDPCDGQFAEYASSSVAGWAASTYRLHDTVWSDGTVALTSPDGTVYTFPGFASPQLASTVSDRNGNSVSYAVNSSGGLQMTDTLGRVLSSSGFATSEDTITIPGMTEAYFVQWANVPASGAVINYIGSTAQPCNNATSGFGGGTAVTSIATPEGAYTFAYDPTYGEVDRITYPNGGYVRYVWGLNPQSEGEQLQKWDGSEFEPCYVHFDNPVITDRYVSADGTHEVEHQSFQYSTTWDGTNNNTWSSKQTVVTTTDFSTGAVAVETNDYLPGGTGLPPNSGIYVAGEVPLEQTVTTASGGTTLRTITESWTGGGDDQPAEVQTVLSGINVSDIVNSYNSNAQLTEQDAYSYPAGAHTLQKKTTVSYAGFSQNIVDRPAIETVYNGSGTQQAQSSFGYDSNANLLSLARWVAGSSTLNWGFTYNAYGGWLTTTEPNSAVTTYSYADNWAGSGPSGLQAYVTKVTDALGHTDSYSWNYASGTVASHTDQNSNVTSFAYDPWVRLDQVNYPDGGETTYAYTPSTLETKRKIDASRWTDAWTLFDGLGRAEATSTLNGSGTYDRTDTCYNGVGEVSFRSYPYFASSGTAAPNCSGVGDSFQFDALGRETVETHSDGSTFLTSYAGRATETQDEGNGTTRVTRISQDDGLGNLQSVCEITGATDAAGNVPGACNLDIAGTGFLTAYQHDALGNLTGVTQGAETRSFQYDGLSRLLSANNPETGTILYQYDSNPSCPAADSFPGDLASRTDARGIRTCYQWDPLHRLTLKSYSDGTAGAAYWYDQATGLGTTFTNPVGRLTSEQEGEAVKGFGYDPMGRVNYTTQGTPNVYGRIGFVNNVKFDFAGDLDWDQSTYNSGAIFTTVFDQALRPVSLTSSLDGPLISNLAYNARGQEASAMLGNGVAESRVYDVRGRATSISDGSAYSWTAASLAPDGGLLQSTDLITGNYAYQYNDLNQLTQACNSFDCTHDVDQFVYDRYGNRWRETPSWAPQADASIGTFNGGNNRFDQVPYDASGDLLYTGYAYDAEHQLTSLLASGTTANYVYDAEGRRVHETVGGTVKEYIYGMGAIEQTVVDANQNQIAAEAYLGGRYLGTRTPSGFVWAYANNVGTVRKRSNGEADWEWPFGSSENYPNGTSPTHFTGKVYDSESGYSYFGARYYRAYDGRWLTPDFSAPPGDPEPIPFANLENPQSLNLYSYVLNNPVSNTDPDGHLCLLGHNFLGGFGGSCGKPSKLPVKEGGLAHALIDPYLKAGKDVSRTYAEAAKAVTSAAKRDPLGMMLAVIPGFGEEEAATAGAKSLDEILEGAIDEGGSASRILSKPGGMAEAAKDFEALPGQAADKGGGVFIKELPDGGKAVLRGSSDGRRTIEIQHADGSVTKIRYGSGGGAE